MAPAKKSSAKTHASKMSQAHKDALAKGREASRAVRAYLDALEASKPKRGRRRSPESIQKRLDEIEQELTDASAFERLGLFAEAERLEASLDQLSSGDDLGPLRKGFVKWAKTYGEAKGIRYGTWRAAGVSAEDLKAAKITRSGR